ncbi:MAG TPA: bifunctional hydroxymethylpyrimidine kinase/phosphomethylpyrimidine kinase, partial [Stellaceae bacterium]|nr:bifunctional hydroxymethylpyrimidine kinase/phosphomethylpyrimidine kinase [Stellaceae bacterium]
MKGRVLIIAGSDSGGGAGIQADIKAVTTLGAYAATAVTALTAQNTIGVQGILPVAPDFVKRQIDSVLADIGADCIKTGMLLDHSVIEVAGEALERAAPTVPLVVDPVMVASTGARLLDP